MDFEFICSTNIFKQKKVGRCMDLEKTIKQTIKKYNLLSKKEKVLVALSGGKDSTTVLYFLKKLGYNVEALLIDLNQGDYSSKGIVGMEKFCEDIGVRLHVLNLFEEGIDIRKMKIKILKERKLSPCAVCGIVKKYYLNYYAKKLKADKLVTGHNLDDECQTVLMNFLKGNVLLGLNSTPATGGSAVKGFVQRVKPLFFVPEDEVRKFALRKRFPIVTCECPDSSRTYRISLREDFVKHLDVKSKLRIVRNFQKVIKKLRKEHQRDVRYCEVCGEPARGKLCKLCELVG
jgi:uncharacterized protein (TIGR00269 family)